MINTVLGNLIIFSSAYIVVLIFISPFIDHIFTTLEQDKVNKNSNIKILIEIILHIIVLTVIWYASNKYFTKFLEKSLNVKVSARVNTAVHFIASVALVGLQRNLVDKLEYISYVHPFRIIEL